LLANDRGILVPFADPEAIADGVNRFLADPILMTATRKRAWKLGRTLKLDFAWRFLAALFGIGHSKLAGSLVLSIFSYVLQRCRRSNNLVRSPDKPIHRGR
jgi:glycosyltransferase involved in cell wall biosynthesis